MLIAERAVRVIALFAFVSLLPACSGDEVATSEQTASLESIVEPMARIGAAYSPALSADGSRVAYLTRKSGIPQVWIADAGGHRQVTSFDNQVTDFDWAPDSETLAVEVAPGGGLNTQIYLMAAAGGEPRQITEGGRVNNNLVGFDSTGRYVSYSSNANAPGSMDSFLYDTESGDTILLAENNGIGFTADMTDDAARAIVWRMVSRGDSNLYVLDRAGGNEYLATPHEGTANVAAGEFFDAETVLLSTDVDRERYGLARIDLDASGAPGPLEYLVERDDADLDDIYIIPGSSRLLLSWNVAGRSELSWFDMESGESTPGPTLPAELVGSRDISADGRVIGMTISGSTVPTNVWTMNVESGEFTQVSESSHEGVDLDSLVKPTLHTYTAHDGLELSGWLYRPAGQEGPGPVVMHYHGGPEGQSRPSFFTTAQALVARGFSVFSPNVRGSAGFGKTFVNLDNGALRVNAVRDIESTMDFLIEERIAAPDRIGIMGGSYGGYMVMAGMTEYPDRIAAGANLFGIVNFATFFENTEAWMAAISTIEYGDPETEADMLRELSPIHKLNRIRAPLIVLHGANDTNVPVIEAEQIVATLKEGEVPVDYVLFPDEGHGWRKVENRVTSDVAIVGWFESHL